MLKSLKGRFVLLIFAFLLAANASIFLDIVILRQILGFVFLAFIPGIIILNILKLNKLGLTEKAILSIGLSISFVMFMGLFINCVYPIFGYSKPLTTDSILISFSVIMLLLAIIASLRNPSASFLGISKPNLNTSEKSLLLLPAFFPLLSILGMNIMNTANNNNILMILLFLIPAYAIVITILRNRITDKTYPLLIFFISISLLLLHALRSNYILGVDTHEEYYLFQIVLRTGHWAPISKGPLDACLSISLLPAIYQSFLNINPEYLFKLLYPLFVSVLPLVIFVISKKYVGGFYAFLASLFFMAQYTFLWTTADARTNLGILFFSLTIMILFLKELNPLGKRILFVIFAASCTASHYSSTYLFFFILLATWIGMEIISSIMRRRIKIVAPPTSIMLENSSQGLSQSKGDLDGSNTNAFGIGQNNFQFKVKRYVTLPILATFFILIYFWYAQVSPGAFSSAVGLFQRTFLGMKQFFILESRGSVVASIMGTGVFEDGIPGVITLIFSWLTVALIGVGIICTIVMYPKMILVPNSLKRKLDFLAVNIDIEFFVISLACSSILFLSVVFPYVLKGYALDRTYFQMVTVLSPFFVIGGLMIAKLCRSSKAYLVILLILIPYLLCQTGIIYQVFGSPQDITLNSNGPDYSILYTHDQEHDCAIWLKNNIANGNTIYSDFYSEYKLMSQGLINPLYQSLIENVANNQAINEGYIFLRYTNVVDRVLEVKANDPQNLAEYQNVFNQESLIYNNGGSQVWK